MMEVKWVEERKRRIDICWRVETVGGGMAWRLRVKAKIYES